MKSLFLISFSIIFLAGCASSMPAPVVNKSPQNNHKTTTSSKSTSGDWRPDSYTVKRGDTLYSIGLNHGLDYREIAAANNISEPFTINIGQKLNIASLKSKGTTDNPKPSAYENEDGVIISPIDIDAPVTAKATESVVTPVLSQPSAIREPYSLEALNRKPVVNKPTTVATLPNTPPIKKTAIPASAGTSAWAWPTKGNVIAKFNGSKNKGIDIAGKKGQAITASAKGKVIYAGSDLRGYGKLVIIKHNKTFLSVYAHNSKITVKEGQIVSAGQNIAAMGDTDTNRVKLHFEIRERGKSVNPEKYLPKN